MSVRKKERVPLPTLTDPTGMPQHLSVFLQQPAGTQSMLNTKALQKCEYLGDDVFRCYLPKLTLLNFEVAPIVDLFVAASDIDCQVEMRSCMVGFSNLPHLKWILAVWRYLELLGPANSANMPSVSIFHHNDLLTLKMLRL